MKTRILHISNGGIAQALCGPVRNTATLRVNKHKAVEGLISELPLSQLRGAKLCRNCARKAKSMGRL